MATAEQVATIIEIMQQQSQQVAQLMLQQQQQQHGNTGGDKTKKADRPTINVNLDDREWAIFEDKWHRYKLMIGVSSDRANDAEKIRMELRESCSSDVNKMLFEFVGPDVLNTCTEAALLAHIKKISVKQTHPEVHQASFNSMTQEQGESATQWVARLKSKAFLCQFEVPCGCDPPRTVSYADQMVSQRLVAGLANMDHKRKLLSEASTLTTLDAKIERLQLLETTEESAAVLHRNIGPVHVNTSAEASAAHSQFKRNDSKPGTGKTPPGGNCKGCGQAAHPGGRSKCHAFKKKCNSCGKKGHLAVVCFSNTQSTQSTPAQDDTDVEYDSVDEIIHSESSVSFSLGDQQDFRSRRRRNECK